MRQIRDRLFKEHLHVIISNNKKFMPYLIRILEMLNKIKDKKISTRFEPGKSLSFKEYKTNPEFEVYWLKDLYK